MKKHLLLFLLVITSGISYAETADENYNATYIMLKTQQLSRVRSSCVSGKKFNSIHISYWEPLAKEARDNEMKIALLESGKYTVSFINEFMSHYNSALIAVMKELCPDVW